MSIHEHGRIENKSTCWVRFPKRGRVAYVETGNFTKYEVNECNLDVATALLAPSRRARQVGPNKKPPRSYSADNRENRPNAEASFRPR
jgi:hypothetical protein